MNLNTIWNNRDCSNEKFIYLVVPLPNHLHMIDECVEGVEDDTVYLSLLLMGLMSSKSVMLTTVHFLLLSAVCLGSGRSRSLCRICGLKGNLVRLLFQLGRRGCQLARGVRKRLKLDR